MPSSFIPLSEILSAYLNRDNYSPAFAGCTLSDGTRIYLTSDMSGIRVFRSLEHPNYRKETGYYPFK